MAEIQANVWVESWDGGDRFAVAWFIDGVKGNQPCKTLEEARTYAAGLADGFDVAKSVLWNRRRLRVWGSVIERDEACPISLSDGVAVDVPGEEIIKKGEHQKWTR